MNTALPLLEAAPPRTLQLPDSAREGLARTPFGLYVHVPFCATRCGYCDFNTYTADELGPGASRAEYAGTAIAELRQAAETLGPALPASAHAARSDSLIGREASEMWVSPRQNFLKPPPVPEMPTVTRTSRPLAFWNSSATASVTGNTVLEPSICTVSAAPAAPAAPSSAAANAALSMFSQFEIIETVRTGKVVMARGEQPT